MSEDKRTYRLNKETSQKSVNEDTFDKIQLESKTNIIPINDINKTISVDNQFNSERNNSSLYRVSGTFNSLFNNVLFNTSGTNSYSTFNSDLFRDRSFPPDTLTNDDEEDLTYAESIDFHLKEDNGWFGFRDPDQAKEAICSWADMNPSRDLFVLSPTNNIKNWELTVTYPANNLEHNIAKNSGLLMINLFKTVIGNRDMMTFSTPVKHGLSQGDNVRLSGLNSNNGDYVVVRLGENNGDNKEYFFSVEININTLFSDESNTTPRISRLVNGEKSLYYFRMFKKMKVKGDITMEDDDYEIFPLAFSQNIYEDKNNHFVINEDIDVSNITDNLGRPLSEIYITLIKTNSSGNFTTIKSGLDIPNISGITQDIQDIRRITNSTESNDFLDENVLITDDVFYGDVAEFNLFEQKEVILGEVNHRFNTYNRETNSSVPDTDFNGLSIDLGERYEGYMYKPHHRVELRKYSNYVEEGTESTLNRPIYSDTLGRIGDGRYLWRDLLDVGVNDTQEEFLDYPFLNGIHYINNNISLPLQRQDPFGFYELKYDKFPADISGTLIDDGVIIKKSQDVC